MKSIILALLLSLCCSQLYADCSAEQFEYAQASSAYKKVVHKLYPKIKAGKKLTKKEARELDRANARVYNAQYMYQACVNGSSEGNNFGGVDY